MSTEDAKAYLSQREVPRLFECLMTGLMFHRPNDHIQYLIDSLEKVKQKGQADLTWNMFVEVRSAKTPLPPITPDNGKRPVSRGRITPKEEPRPITPAAKHSPLPPIGSSGLPNVPVVMIMGGPGSGKAAQASRLAEKHPGWVNIHVGDMLREEMTSKGVEEKWQLVKELVTNGELAPEDITLNLIDECMKNNMEANGYIIQGFPRDIQQSQNFEKRMSRLDAVFLLDCEEGTLTEKVLMRGQSSGRLDDTPGALAKRLANFKDKTLPLLKNYDDMGKLYVIDGEQDEEAVHDELSIIFETLLQNLENGRIPSPPAHAKPSSGRRSRKSASPYPPISPSAPLEPDVVINMPIFTYVPPPELKVKDEGRLPGLPQAPIIFVSGGPGSGKGTQCQNITERYPDIVHLSMGDILRKQISEKGTADEKWAMVTKLLKEGDMAPVDITEELLINSMKEHSDAKAYIIEGYPRDILQYEDFNRHIGGQSFTILLDCDDNYLRQRLVLRGSSGMDRIDDNIPAIEKKLAFFARNTLPLLKVLDDEGKLIVVDGDRDEQEIFFDIVKCLDFSLYGLELEEAKTADEPAADDDKDDDGGEVGDNAADPRAEEPTQDDSDGKAEVVEESMTSQSAPVPTGALIDNPSYSAELDALAPTEDEGLQEHSPREDQEEAGDVTRFEEDVPDDVEVGGVDLTRNPDLQEEEDVMAEDEGNQNQEEETGSQKGEKGKEEEEVEVEIQDTNNNAAAETVDDKADQDEKEESIAGEGGDTDGADQNQQEPEIAQSDIAPDGDDQQEPEMSQVIAENDSGNVQPAAEDDSGNVQPAAEDDSGNVQPAAEDDSGNVQAESQSADDDKNPDGADASQSQNDEEPAGSGKTDEGEKSGDQDGGATETQEEAKPAETTENSNSEETNAAGGAEGAAKEEDNSGDAGAETKTEEGEEAKPAA